MTDEEKIDEAFTKAGDALTSVFTLIAVKGAAAVASVAEAVATALKGKD